MCSDHHLATNQHTIMEYTNSRCYSLKNGDLRTNKWNNIAELYIQYDYISDYYPLQLKYKKVKKLSTILFKVFLIQLFLQEYSFHKLLKLRHRIITHLPLSFSRLNLLASFQLATIFSFSIYIPLLLIPEEITELLAHHPMC